MKKYLSIIVSMFCIVLLGFGCKTSTHLKSDDVQMTPIKVSILGDSYSTFKGYVLPDTNLVWYPDEKRKNDVIKVEQTWWHQVIDSMGWSLEVNNSYSGATICNTGYRQDDYSDRSFITRMDSLGNPDVILVFGATNDSWAKSPIGEYKYSDWTKEELYSFRPAMAKMLHGLKQLYPDAKVYFLLNTGLKQEVNDTVHELCARYDVYCIDLKDIDKQQGHPSIAGMKSIAMQVLQTLRERF